MFSEPQTVTIDAVPHTLARTGMSTTEGIFTESDGSHVLTVQQLGKGARRRRVLRLDSSKITTDPLSDANMSVSMASYLVVNVPLIGYTVTEAQDEVTGFLALCQASSGAAITKLLGGEL